MFPRLPTGLSGLITEQDGKTSGIQISETDLLKQSGVDNISMLKSELPNSYASSSFARAFA